MLIQHLMLNLQGLSRRGFTEYQKSTSQKSLRHTLRSYFCGTRASCRSLWKPKQNPLLTREAVFRRQGHNRMPSPPEERQRSVHPGTTATISCVLQLSVALKTTNDQSLRFFTAKSHIVFSLQVAEVKFEWSSSCPLLKESLRQPDQDGIFYLLAAAQLQNPPVLHLPGLQSSQSTKLLVGWSY